MNHIDTHVAQLLSKLITSANSADVPNVEKYWLDQIGASLRAIEAFTEDGGKVEGDQILCGLSTRSDDELQSFILGYHQHAIPIDGDSHQREYFLGWIQNCALRHVILAPKNGMDQFNRRLEALQRGSEHNLILI